LIKNISYHKLFFFPMYDACSKWQIEKWVGLYKCHIVCFSKALYNRLLDYGFQASYFQYFPQISEIPLINGDTQSCFHWFRRSEIKTHILPKLLPFLQKIYLHQAPDPFFSVNDNNIPTDMDISISQWFNNKNDLYNIMQNSALYLCPRPQEGIGMSFLEAMAQARCVVAPNIPTMNEYIKHKVTGILYDINNPQAIDITEQEIRNIQNNTSEFMQAGYEKWSEDKYKLLDMICGDTQIFLPKPTQYFTHILLRLIKNPFKVRRLFQEFKKAV